MIGSAAASGRSSSPGGSQRATPSTSGVVRTSRRLANCSTSTEKKCGTAVRRCDLVRVDPLEHGVAVERLAERGHRSPVVGGVEDRTGGAGVVMVVDGVVMVMPERRKDLPHVVRRLMAGWSDGDPCRP